MIQALNTLIHFISSPEYNSPLQSKEYDDLLKKSFYELTDYAEDYGAPYSDIRWGDLDDDWNRWSFLFDFDYENIFLDVLLNRLKKLEEKYQSILFIPDDFDTFNDTELFNFILEIYIIIHSYKLLNIHVSKYPDYSYMLNYFDNINKSVSNEINSNDFYSVYKIKISDNPSIWFWDKTIHHLCDFLYHPYNQKNQPFDDFIIEIDETFYYCDNFIPLEYLIIKKVFISFLNKVKEICNDTKCSCFDVINEIDILSIIKNVIKYYQDIELSSYTEEYLYVLLDDDSNLADSEYTLSKFINEYSSHCAPLLYYKLRSKPDIIELFMPAIKAYLMFSKYPLARCSHCHKLFLKTSPNRKFCDSTLTLKSDMTCKEEREAITDHKSLYQKTTNDFKQYLQKVTLKGGPSYTLRVKNILEKNKYFDTKKPKSFDNLSKTDKKDLLWVLNSFFNYSYAIMESMSFQKIVENPTFKDVRYYNNSPENNFTPLAYKELFEEYKKYTRTNKDSNTTEIINIYNSFVEFSKSKNNTLNFKTIRSKSMQVLNGDDVAKLFQITEIVIHTFILRLSDWYLVGNKDKPEFTYAFPKEFATFELSNIQYMSQDDIKKLENKINKAQQNPDMDSYFITMNEAREDKIIDLVTNLEESIIANH